MKHRSKLTVLNFGALLSPELVEQMEEELDRKVEDRRIRLSINAVKFTYPQVLRAMDSIDLSSLSTDTVLNLPKLPIAAAYIVNEFFARTGIHPTILELIRDQNELDVRRFGTLRNLELEISATRSRRRNRLVSSVLDAIDQKKDEQ